ncbi:MAG: hypothetical protein ACTJHK_02770 [Enterococcus viikkiensis]
MEISDVYETDLSHVELSIFLPCASVDLDDPLFQFNATYYVNKNLSLEDDEDISLETVPIFTIIGHTGDFDHDFIYTADAIAESTIENYSFAKGLYERVFDTEFHNEIISDTGNVMSRWVTLETVVLKKEIENASEEVQAYLFAEFLLKWKQTWKQLFCNDITMVSFNERLYVSPEKDVQKFIEQAYNKAEFFPTLNKQNLIEESEYTEHNNFSLKEIFELDSNNQLFSKEIKDGGIKHYSGFIY